jgi:hypothetical protein
MIASPSAFGVFEHRRWNLACAAVTMREQSTNRGGHHELDSRIQRQPVNCKGRARMTPFVTEHLDEEIGGVVEHAAAGGYATWFAQRSFK